MRLRKTMIKGGGWVNVETSHMYVQTHMQKGRKLENPKDKEKCLNYDVL